MEEEMASLKENGTYTLTPLSSGRWVYTIKECANGSKSYKVRYVAKGYSQKEGIFTFAPTAQLTSVRVVMQLAAQNGLMLHQMDLKMAPIDFEMYLEQPEGFEAKTENGEQLFCRLNKSLYGLKQSSRNWNKMLNSFLTLNEFEQSTSDNCAYTKYVDNEMIVILFGVEDVIVGASNENLLGATKQLFKENVKMKDMEQLSYFLGIDFEQGQDFVRMHQQRYIQNLLEKIEMSDYKPRCTPCEQKLEWSESEPFDSKRYREVVGSLIYLMMCTRPDKISWVVT